LLRNINVRGGKVDQRSMGVAKVGYQGNLSSTIALLSCAPPQLREDSLVLMLASSFLGALSRSRVFLPLEFVQRALKNCSTLKGSLRNGIWVLELGLGLGHKVNCLSLSSM